MQSATIIVPVGGSVQSAYNDAQCGDTIVVQAGAAYNANLIHNKVCAFPVTIQSSRASELPAGVRVAPAQALLLARLQSTVAGEPVIKTAAGARGLRLVGLEITTQSSSTVVFDLVRLGEGRQLQKTLESVPRDIVIDRSYIHGWPDQEVQRGVSLNSADTTISNSWISDIHLTGNDSQAIAGWNGTLNVRSINNYLAGAGENAMFGGADAAIEALIPSSIEIFRNHIHKPLSWKVGDPSYAGKHWTIKNLLELKNAKDVKIEGNVFENNWTDGQSGIPILFTVRNQECTNPFATIQNVSFTNNTLRNAEGVFNFLGKDNEAEPTYEDRAGHPKCSDPGESFGSVRGNGFVASNNLFYEIRGHFWTMNGFDGVSMDHNTHVQQGNLTTIYGEPSNGLRYTKNLTIDHQYGIWTEAGVGVVGLNKLAPGWVWSENVTANPYDKISYPANNNYPESLTLPADFRSPYPDRGADIDQLLAAQNGTVTGPVTEPSPVPSPSPSPTLVPSPTPVPTPKPTDYEWTRFNFSGENQLETALKNAGAQGYGSCVIGPSGKSLYCARVKQ